jgi:hypothetical protein
MSGSELRAYCLSAVLTVLLGVCIGFGWHYFADSAGVRAVASAATPRRSTKRPNPHRRTCRRNKSLQSSMLHGFQRYRTPNKQLEATREVKAAPKVGTASIGKTARVIGIGTLRFKLAVIANDAEPARTVATGNRLLGVARYRLDCRPRVL